MTSVIWAMSEIRRGSVINVNVNR